jgi:transposase InsO family protein
MPWREVTAVSQRREFVALALQADVSISQLCGRFGISRKTGYKWLGRFNEGGLAGLEDKSRRPHSCPNRTEPDVEHRVLELRDKHPAWGGRKLHRRLEDLGESSVPAPSTITGILTRNDRIDLKESEKHEAWQRFEHAEANDLWQMDFKSPVTTDEGVCHPLTVIDDHSRFSVLLEVCADQRTETVRDRLTQAFRRYGLPWRIVADNGSPWGGQGGCRFTKLTVWLIHLGISVSHGRAYHPQTQGKDERFHGTLEAEVLRYCRFKDIEHCQRHLSRWRDVYNLERPHEAIEMAVPQSRYSMSKRSYPSTLAPVEYGPDDLVRKVQQDGMIFFRGGQYLVGKAFFRHPVGVRPTAIDGIFDVFFCHQKVTTIDIAKKQNV